MAISFVGRTSALPGTPSGTALTVTLPGGYAADDVLLVCIEAAVAETVTPPAGWTSLAAEVYGSGSAGLRVFAKAATGSEGASQVFTVTASETYEWCALAYRGAAPTTYAVATNNSGLTTGASWTSPSFSAAVESWAVAFFRVADGLSGHTKDAGSTLRSATLDDKLVALDRVTGPGTTSGSTMNYPVSVYGIAVTVGLRPANSAPYAPTLNLPASGETIDVGSTNVFYFTFNDPDQDLPRAEGQLKYEIRYQNVASPGWTTLTPANTPDEFHTFAASTFTTAINYEWQVRTYDLAGVVGPWSSSGFFTGGTAPAAPSITDPTLDEEITANSFEVDWTVTTQTAYQIRTVADVAGSPDTTVVYYDSGTQADSAARSVWVPFPTNNRTEHIQLRVWDGTLWSAWTSVRVDVAYTPPPTPTWDLSVDAETASLVVDYETPPPTGLQPTPVVVKVWINDGGDYVDEVKEGMDDLPLSGSVSHMTMRSGRDYTTHVRVVSYSADGVPSE